MNSFLKDLSSFSNNKDVKHVFHKLSPITDALIAKGASKVQSLKKGGRVKGAKKGMPKMIKAHVGEYVIPVGVKVPKSVKAAVAKKHKKPRMKMA
jgi:hypothetical protein